MMEAQATRSSLSDFALFHIEFMGYDIYDKTLDCFISKYVLWHCKKELCRVMVKRRKTISRYKLINREGWINGYKIETDETD